MLPSLVAGPWKTLVSLPGRINTLMRPPAGNDTSATSAIREPTRKAGTFDSSTCISA